MLEKGSIYELCFFILNVAKNLEPEDIFCINCGTRLSDFEENEVAEPFKQQKKRRCRKNTKGSIRGDLTPPHFSSLQKLFIDQDLQEDLRSQRAQGSDYKENRNKKQRLYNKQKDEMYKRDNWYHRRKYSDRECNDTELNIHS